MANNNMSVNLPIVSGIIIKICICLRPDWIIKIQLNSV